MFTKLYNQTFFEFLRPTKVTIGLFFVFVCFFFYLDYIYGFLDMINTFLVGDPVEYKNNFTVEGDPWGLGFAFQVTVFFSLLYILSSFFSLLFRKIWQNFL